MDGTSASAPIFAAIIAVANAARIALGLPVLGFVNPLIYSAAVSSPRIFNDIDCAGCVNNMGDSTSEAACTRRPVSFNLECSHHPLARSVVQRLRNWVRDGSRLGRRDGVGDAECAGAPDGPRRDVLAVVDAHPVDVPDTDALAVTNALSGRLPFPGTVAGAVGQRDVQRLTFV